MKRQYTIHIDIDTDMTGDAFFRQETENSGEVFIRADDEPIPHDKNWALFCLAHELGHAVAEILDLPGMRDDPRNRYRPFREKSFGEGILNSEREAWDIANLIAFGKHRDHYFSGYANAYEERQERKDFVIKRLYREIS